MNPKYEAALLYIACFMLVVFWGLILGILVSEFLSYDTSHWIAVRVRRILLAAGELYN